MSSGWIGVDLDRTLAKYDHWRGPNHIGEPIPLMVDRVKQWLSEGQEVRIVTARVAILDGKETTPVSVIQDWTEKHIGERLAVTNEKTFDMIELWDDRAVQVRPNKGTTLQEEVDELRLELARLKSRDNYDSGPNLRIFNARL